MGKGNGGNGEREKKCNVLEEKETLNYLLLVLLLLLLMLLNVFFRKSQYVCLTSQ